MNNDTPKIYKKDGYSTRIQLSLAEISSSPDDEFRLVKVFYDPIGFTCELCGHKNCMYAYTVQNNTTQLEITIGSECINHFEDKGIDIDLAEGLMKRVYKATAEAREQLRMELGKKAWDSLPEEEKAKVKKYKINDKIEELGNNIVKSMSISEKAQKTVEAYMIIQTKELLADVSKNKYILSKEEIENICSMGFQEELEASQKKAEQNKLYMDSMNLIANVRNYIYTLKYSSADPVLKQNFLRDATKFGKEDFINKLFDEHEKDISIFSQYQWLLDCQIDDATLRSLKSYVLKNKTLSDAQIKLGKNIINMAAGKKDVEIEEALSALMQNSNPFIESVNSFYKSKGFVTPKQRIAIMRAYEKIKK